MIANFTQTNAAITIKRQSLIEVTVSDDLVESCALAKSEIKTALRAL